jgi:hypothetical protein
MKTMQPLPTIPFSTAVVQRRGPSSNQSRVAASCAGPAPSAKASASATRTGSDGSFRPDSNRGATTATTASAGAPNTCTTLPTPMALSPKLNTEAMPSPRSTVTYRGPSTGSRQATNTITTSSPTATHAAYSLSSLTPPLATTSTRAEPGQQPQVRRQRPAERGHQTEHRGQPGQDGRAAQPDQVAQPADQHDHPDRHQLLHDLGIPLIPGSG